MTQDSKGKEAMLSFLVLGLLTHEPHTMMKRSQVVAELSQIKKVAS